MMKLPGIVVESLEKVGGLKSVARNVPPKRHLNLAVEVFHSLSDPIRLSILHALSVSPLCVCVIKSIVKTSDSKLSYHLDCLTRAGIIRGRREGRFIVYEVTDLGRAILSVCDSIW
jgi:ArsR family transcriptional regulator